MLPDRGVEIVVYCMNRECAASGVEVRELRQIGYRNVRHYAGGKQGWIQAGLPVEGEHASDVYHSSL